MTLRFAAAALVLGCLYGSPAYAQQTAAKDGDWPVYGGDPGAQKHSPLRQIDRENVANLEVAWTWEAREGPVPGFRQAIPGQEVYAGRFEAQPVVVNDTMYLSTSYNKVVALDAGTGDVLWTFDPRAYDWGLPPNGSHFVHRGVALWSGDGERRVFINARWWLYALDAATGELIQDFGYKGRVDLTEALTWPSIALHVTQTSAPVVYDDLVVVGNGVWDRFVYRGDPPGVMQAFDVRTGELRWKFDLIPQAGDFGNESWEDGSWREWGHTNVWAPFSLDAERGLLYLPVGTPSSDYFGGHRKGDNLFAESVVCLDARTGERIWHFQAVHHGLWDWDLSSPPTLMTVRHDGEEVDAVVAPSKQGFIYAFDRVTGEPLWPIEERPVPASGVPGERASETQPFPTWPEPYDMQGLTKEAIGGYHMGPIFTPPSMEGTLMLPGIEGGANWGGGAADPETGVFFVKGTESPSLLKLVESDPAQSEATYQVDRSIRSISLPNGLPLIKPPYGTLSAIDMNSGDLLWQVPVGDLLWEQGLGGASSANPMTYQTRGGRQFVVVAVGSGESAKLVAFALPD